jgi:hypothetical protein
MNDFDIKKFLTENKMTRNSRLLSEEIFNIDAELKQYFENNPLTPDNQALYAIIAAEYIEQKAEDMGHVLTPAEKRQITKKAGKYGEEGIISNYTQQRDKKEREDEERKQNNLLPLEIINRSGLIKFDHTDEEQEILDYFVKYKEIPPGVSRKEFMDIQNTPPNDKYYEFRDTKRFTVKGGDVITTHRPDPSGYTNYKLKDEWISTPVDQATLEKYWAET